MTHSANHISFIERTRRITLVSALVAVVGCAATAPNDALTSYGVLPAHQESPAAPKLAELVRSNTKVKRVMNVIRRFAPRQAPTRGLATTIVRESVNAGLEPLFVAAVIKSESTFRTWVKSNKNARGLMQITPITEREVARKVDLSEFEKRDLGDPSYNIRLGTWYLKHLESRYNGNRKLALVAYNWGPGHLHKALKGQKTIPGESLKYAQTIMQNHKTWAYQQ